jgi:hypothetical protein
MNLGYNSHLCLGYTKELFEWLLRQGCSIADAIAQKGMGRMNMLLNYHTAHFEEKYPMGIKCIEAVFVPLRDLESDWLDIAEAIDEGSPDAIARMLKDRGLNALEVRDRGRRTLLQAAALKGRTKILDWLVKTQGANLDTRDEDGRTIQDCVTQLGMQTVVDHIISLKRWTCAQKRINEEKKRKLVNCAVVAQKYYRRFLARTKLQERKETSGLGVWGPVVMEVINLESGIRKPWFISKSWTQIKIEFDLVVQSDLELKGESLEDFYDLQGSQTCSQESSSSITPTDALVAGAPRKIEPGSLLPLAPCQISAIYLTREALHWMRKQKDETYRGLLVKRLGQLANGNRSYCLEKPLKGSSRPVNETKLDAGQRIIWTYRGSAILVWFICQHKHINRCLQLVEQSYKRVLGGLQEWYTPSDVVEPEMLVEPTANVPLRIYTVSTLALGTLAQDVRDLSWTPPLKLTQQEDDIVDKEGAVLLLGRSGTGKTLCVLQRMSRDRQKHGAHLRQLFVACTQRLCDSVQAMQQHFDGDTHTTFITVTDLVKEINISPEDLWDESKCVTFCRFHNQLWKEVKGNEKELDALVVWTQVCFSLPDLLWARTTLIVATSL